MPTMKSVQTAAPGTVQVAEIERPVPGPKDALTGRRCAPGTGSMAHRTGSSRTNGTSAQLGGLALCRTEVR